MVSILQFEVKNARFEFTKFGGCEKFQAGG